MLRNAYVPMNDKSPPGGVHNKLRVQVCATHMCGFLDPEFSKQGSPFGRFSMAKNGWFSAKIHHKSGYDSKFQ